jgi:hypothetical protein
MEAVETTDSTTTTVSTNSVGDADERMQMTDNRTPEDFFASIERAQSQVAANAALTMEAAREQAGVGTQEQRAALRIAWLAKVVDEDPTAGPPPDPAAAAALALAERYGWWDDPVLGPEVLNEIVEIVVGAFNGYHQ